MGDIALMEVSLERKNISVNRILTPSAATTFAADGGFVFQASHGYKYFASALHLLSNCCPSMMGTGERGILSRGD
jgi:hypothetical protein